MHLYTEKDIDQYEKFIKEPCYTISSSKENMPYTNNTKFCSMMLIPSLNKNLEKPNLILESGKIYFYQVFLLYKEELEYKLKTGIDSLLELFNDGDIVSIVNI